jgi:hypothetical protein
VDCAVDIAVDNFVDRMPSAVLGTPAGDRSMGGEGWQESWRVADRS